MVITYSVYFYEMDITNDYEHSPVFSLVLFTNETLFTTESILNIHNKYVWSERNHHIIASSKYQERFSVNVWAGIFGHCLVGPYIFPDRLTGEKYLGRVVPSLLKPVLFITYGVMHDGGPDHIISNVRYFLYVPYLQRWIGGGKLVI